MEARIVDERKLEETVEITVSFPHSLLVAIGVRPQELSQVVREAVAVNFYRRGFLSLGKASEMAGVASNAEMMALLAKHDVWLNNSADDARSDAASLAGELIP